MAEMKTQKNTASVTGFLADVPEQKRKDCEQVLALMKKATGEEPSMWGGSIVGFGSYHYVYDSGREGDWFLCGFSPRKQALSLYIMDGFAKYDDLLARLGKNKTGKLKTGKSCLYVKSLADVDVAVLEKLIEASVRHMRDTYHS